MWSIFSLLDKFAKSDRSLSTGVFGTINFRSNDSTLLTPWHKAQWNNHRWSVFWYFVLATKSCVRFVPITCPTGVYYKESFIVVRGMPLVTGMIRRIYRVTCIGWLIVVSSTVIIDVAICITVTKLVFHRFGKSITSFRWTWVSWYRNCSTFYCHIP
jgi:hypothetical protein